jgi:hypothetical protein
MRVEAIGLQLSRAWVFRINFRAQLEKVGE